jgi:hypothetical protein
LLVELADRLGLTSTLDWRAPQGRRRHPDAQVLRDLAVMLADGGDCLSDLAVLRDQPELFGRIASTPTAWRVIERPPRIPTGWRVCVPPAHMLALARGRPAATPMSSCWSSMPTRPWSWRTVMPSRALPAPTSTPSDSLRCWPTWTAEPLRVRSDSAGGSTKLAWHLRDHGFGFSLGMQTDAHVREAIKRPA